MFKENSGDETAFLLLFGYNSYFSSLKTSIIVPKLVARLDGIYMAMRDINYAKSEHQLARRHQLARLLRSLDIVVRNGIYFKIIHR